jgi:hypothetical protein
MRIERGDKQTHHGRIGRRLCLRRDGARSFSEQIPVPAIAAEQGRRFDRHAHEGVGFTCT